MVKTCLNSPFQMPGIIPPSDTKEFKVTSGDSAVTGFRSRSSDIFSALNSVETPNLTQRHESGGRRESRSHRDDDRASESGRFRDRSHDSDRRRSRQEGDRQRDRESRHRSSGGFTRPFGRPPRRNYTPDFRRNPQNYTEYDLSTTAMHTDRSNTSAALGFLDELRKRREEDRNKDKVPASDYEESGSSGSGSKVWDSHSNYVRRKHKFNKPDEEKVSNSPSAAAGSASSADSKEQSTSSAADDGAIAGTSTCSEEKPAFVRGKLTMPEYVVGQSAKSKVKKDKSKVASCDALSLSHLADEDDAGGDSEDLGERTRHVERKVESVPFKKSKRSRNTRQRTEDD